MNRKKKNYFFNKHTMFAQIVRLAYSEKNMKSRKGSIFGKIEKRGRERGKSEIRKIQEEKNFF